MFHSKYVHFKNPLGALKCGDTVHFRISIPVGYNASSASLLIKRDEETDFEFVTMKPTTVIHNSVEPEQLFECDYTQQNAGIYYYRFSVLTDDGENEILNDGSGHGTFEEGVKDYVLVVYEPKITIPSWIHDGAFFYCNVEFLKDRDAVEELKAIGIRTFVVHSVFEYDKYENNANFFESNQKAGSKEEIATLFKELKDDGFRIVLDAMFENYTMDSEQADEIMNNFSKLREWSGLGIDGVRINTLATLPQGFIEAFLSRVRDSNKDFVIIGYLKSGATIPEQRKVLNQCIYGEGLHTFTNYIFHEAVGQIVMSRDAQKCLDIITNVLDIYPEVIINSSINVVNPANILEMIGEAINRDETKERIVGMVKLGLSLIFTLPGVPMVCQTDQTSLFSENELESLQLTHEVALYVSNLCKMISAHDFLKRAKFIPMKSIPGTMIFLRIADGKAMMVAVNLLEKDIVMDMPINISSVDSVFGGTFDVAKNSLILPKISTSLYFFTLGQIM